MTETQIVRLIDKAKKGNKRAFERLLRQKESNIAYIALGILKNEQDAEDAVQEAVLAMYRSIQDLQDNTSFNSWMYKTVYRSCLHVQNKRKKGSSVELDEDRGNSLIEERTELIPETNQEKREQREYLMGKLDLLPDNYRTAMYLFYFEDMPYAEIAEVMGGTKKDVSNWLERGKAKLRSELEKDGITDSKETQTMLGASSLGAVFAADMSTSLTEDQKNMVAHALEVLFGAAGTGVVSSITSTVSGTVGAILASRFLPALISGLAIVAALSIAAFVFFDHQETRAIEESVVESVQEDSETESEESDANDQDQNTGEGENAASGQESEVGGSTISEGRDEDGLYFVIENEVYYEIMDEYDEDKLNSDDDPESTSNMVSAVVSEGQPWSQFAQTGDVFLFVGVVCAAIALMALVALLVSRKRR